MGLFDRFKKKEPHYDITNIRINDLDVGFVFEYDLSTWEVKAIYEYDWGDNYFTREYKIFNGEKTLFLSLEEDDGLVLSVSEKIKVRALGQDVFEDLLSKQKPPDKITYDGRIYLFEKETPGYFHDITGRSDQWDEFISWDFEDQSGEYVLTIEQWGEKEFEASSGKFIKEFQASNILPSSE